MKDCWEFGYWREWAGMVRRGWSDWDTWHCIPLYGCTEFVSSVRTPFWDEPIGSWNLSPLLLPPLISWSLLILPEIPGISIRFNPFLLRSLNLNLTILSKYELLLSDPKSLITSALVCWEFCDALENQKGSEGNRSSCHVSVPLGSPWGNLPYQGLSLGWSVVRMERKGVFSFNSWGSSSLVQNC